MRLRLFAAAREAAGRASDTFEAATLDRLLDAARDRYGARFTAVLAASRVWVNGLPPDDEHQALRADDEVAVLPPVSGGARSGRPSPDGRGRPPSAAGTLAGGSAGVG